MMIKDQTLFSIVVVSYNSEDTIIETLNSAKSQSYSPLELIIADDGSSDNTVEKCKEWLKINGDRFESSQIITSEINKGTSANCNRALYAANGKWIKYLGADDTLMPNCIKDFSFYILQNPSCKWIASVAEEYWDTFDEYNKINTDSFYNRTKPLFDLSFTEQLHKMVREVFIIAPSQIYEKDLLLSVGGFDEKYRLLEDAPMHIKLLEKGVRCFFLDKSTIRYRRKKKSSNSLFNQTLIEDQKKVFDDLRQKYLTRREKKEFLLCYSLRKKICSSGHNKPSAYNKAIYSIGRILSKIISYF